MSTFAGVADANITLNLVCQSYSMGVTEDINWFSWQMLSYCLLWGLLELWAACITGDHELVLVYTGTLENKQKVLTWKDPRKYRWENAGISPDIHPESNGVLQSCPEGEIWVPCQYSRLTPWGHMCSSGLQPFSHTLPLGIKVGITGSLIPGKELVWSWHCGRGCHWR